MQKDARKTTSLCNSKMSRSNWRNRSSIPNLSGISCQRLNGKLWSKPLDKWAWTSRFVFLDIAGVFTDEEWWKVAWWYFTSGASAGYARRWFPESLASCSLRGKQFLLDSVCNTFYNVISFPDTCGGRRDDMMRWCANGLTGAITSSGLARRARWSRRARAIRVCLGERILEFWRIWHNLARTFGCVERI